ncbi:hypothetical protein [Nostoc sp.]|uniref:hypothetical protein n=1 Tax=Nostoc sp. TaxID=1180 RepID=UPI002FF4785E
MSDAQFCTESQFVTHAQFISSPPNGNGERLLAIQAKKRPPEMEGAFYLGLAEILTVDSRSNFTKTPKKIRFGISVNRIFCHQLLYSIDNKS